MKVYEPIPKLSFVEKTKFAGATTLYNSHVLYNAHELYLGAQSSGPYPLMGCVEDIKP